tara:strand:- start:933 stop:1403 length:471 start_codon:yes stop_codon:yes gene_type:complete
MRSLIEKTCFTMGEKFASSEAVDLVLATGIVESGYKYIRQLGDGPAKSFWQIEPSTAVDTLAHFLVHRSPLMHKCAEASMVDLKHWQSYDEYLWSDILEKNIAAGIVHCRLKYWRVPKPIPNTTQGKSEYWKKYYNSEGGAGNPEHFAEAVDKWLV